MFDPAFIPQWDGTCADWTSIPDPKQANIQSIVKKYWKVSSQVLISLSKQLLDIKGELLDPSGFSSSLIKPLLYLIRELLKRRNDFLQYKISSASGKIVSSVTAALKSVTSTPDRFASSIALEVSLMPSLCSSDCDITTASIECLAYMVEEVELTGEAKANVQLDLTSQELVDIALDLENVSSANHDPPVSACINTTVENIHVYAELKKLVVGGAPIITGQKSLQKKIRKVLRMIRKPNPVNMGAWNEIYKRWKLLSQIHITRSTRSNLAEKEEELSSSFSEKMSKTKTKLGPSHNISTETPPNNEFVDDKGEWQNYTGFLAALGGVCISASTSNLQEVVDPKTLSNSLIEDSDYSIAASKNSSTDKLLEPDLLSITWSGLVGSKPISASFVDYKIKVERFLADMVELTMSENVMVRETIKDFLGSELSNSLIGKLICLIFNRLEIVCFV